MLIRNPISLGNVLLSLSEALDLANRDIAFHQQRTSFIAYRLAMFTSLDKKMIQDVFIASLLHDIGAITVEEKTSLHRFEEADVNLHCVRGKLLLKRYDRMGAVAELVREHHRKWSECDGSMDDPLVMGAQIIHLADYVERLCMRNENILLQTECINERVRSLSGDYFNPVLVEYFMKLSAYENFWLDLVSPKIYSELLHSGPLAGIDVEYDDLEMISKLFRDIIDFKSPFTAAHSVGVSACSEILAKLAGFPEREILDIKIAGNLHDLGKLMITRDILEKRGALSDREARIMRSHPYYTYHTIKTIRGLESIAEMAGFHHEKLDGSGYPFRHSGSRLSPGARIVAVADITTALIEERPYRTGMDSGDVVRILKDMKMKGALDGDMVDMVVKEFSMIYDYIVGKEDSIREFYSSRFEAVRKN